MKNLLLIAVAVFILTQSAQAKPVIPFKTYE